ncbi:recombinase XerC [Virgibacillus profundi]|uniref:Recombinase XerC n=1 Tax=Virgibacillus profundi TaxID=2024555 RepID=A0A2A2IDB8_9BACI|nr:tyrosine-type recombinase/integrase [Virgibacillus profundi]PAV29264.1 recombinase XerC [Virgibacillus profundi]PXY53433.1 site-specific integrase [Virgibacillus profundi]
MKLYKTKKDPELFYYYNAKNAKMWLFRHKYYDSLGKRKEKYKQGFEKENEAYRALLEVKTNILNGNVKQVSNANLTISEWLDIWYEIHKGDWKVSSQMQRKGAIKYQMKPLLGKYKLSDLDKTTYKRVYINELLKKKYKPSSVHMFHKLFQIAINAAVDDEIIPRNRFNKIVIEQEDQADNFLTAEELNIFLNAAKSSVTLTNYSLILTLAYTGLRRGEALGLTWDNIGFEGNTLTVERTRDKKGVRSPKTKRSYRKIIIDDALVKQLEVYKKWCKKTLLSFGKHLKDDDYIFISSRSGEPVTENAINYSFKVILKKTKLKKITPHGLRHTHATILIGQRIPVKVIADRLGNTPNMILEIYSHSFKELEEESVTAFGESLRIAGGIK